MFLVSIKSTARLSFQCPPVDRNVKDLASNECTDVPADNGDEDLITGKVIGSEESNQQKELDSREGHERLTCPEYDRCSRNKCWMLEQTCCTMP